MEKVNISEKFALFAEHWSPKILGRVNDFYVKAVKFQGEFVWHKHELEDEMFMPIKGRMTIRFRDRDIRLDPGEFLIVPHGVEHMPVAGDEVHCLVFEPAETVNTGDVENERTRKDLEWI